MNDAQLEDIRGGLVSRGWDDITDEEIREFQRTGSVPESTVGEDYDLAKAFALEAAFDDAGVEIG